MVVRTVQRPQRGRLPYPLTTRGRSFSTACASKQTGSLHILKNINLAGLWTSEKWTTLREEQTRIQATNSCVFDTICCVLKQCFHVRAGGG